VVASCPEALKGSKDGYFHHLKPGPGAHSTALHSTARCTSVRAEPDFGEQPCTDTLGFRAGGARHPPAGPIRHTCCSAASEGAAGQTFASWNRITGMGEAARATAKGSLSGRTFPAARPHS
jgi:hypothetical protein